MKANIGVVGGAEVERASGTTIKIRVRSHWFTELWRDGELIDQWDQYNTMPNQFRDHMLDAVLSDATSYATWYIGLISDATLTPATTMTYATPGFTEATSYTGDRKVWQEAGVSSGSITNEASKASFTLNGNDTSLSGYFLTNVSTPGDTAAANGILGPVSAFSSGSKTSLENGDIMKVYCTVSLTDAAQA